MTEAILQMIVFGLISPAIAVPAFLFGWAVRRWWLVPVGAIAIAAIFLIHSIVDFEAASEGEVVWAAIPFAVLPPLGWCSAGFWFGRWRRQHRETPPGGSGRAVNLTVGLVFGAALGVATGWGLGEIYVEIARVSPMEGYAGYLVVFFFMAPGLMIGAIAGVAAGLAVNRRLSSRHLPAA